MVKADDYEENQPIVTEVAFGAGTDLPLPGVPVTIRINLPFDLIRMAHLYPAIDWNAVMKHAVETGVKQRILR